MDILENGLHSLKNAIHNLKKLETASEDEREYIIKDAIIGLHHSTETLFKYLVKENQEILIYKDLNDYFTKEMKHILTGNVGVSKGYQGNTITFLEAIDRAAVLNNLEISEIDYGAFKRLNILRNSITHHEYDLTEDLIKFLITQVLTIVFPIYKDNLPDFKAYVEQHELDLKGTNQVNDFHIWRFIRHFSLLKKFFSSIKSLESLRENDIISKKHLKEKEKEKESFIRYYDCPFCKEEFFKKEHVYFEGGEEVMYYGQCLLCNTSLNKDDAQYIQITYGNYDSFLKYFKTDLLILKDLLNDEGLASRITPEDISAMNEFVNDDDINEFLVEYIERIFDNTLFHILVDECASIDYDSSELDNAVTWDTELKVHIEINELHEFDILLIKQMISNCTVLLIKPEICNQAFKQAVEEEMVINTIVDHRNPQTEEDVEVDVEISFNINPKIFN
ncbi:MULTISPECIES: hypothetical protein [Bacillus cereus group]|uniref:Uncharacterized protein n=1 Tax=Bacillus thuringiensis TaxID=1428 RepID=A0A9X7FWQ7_BACTU|nr:hypothetical protein [Bacillus thuringiensis]MCQ6333878.1 hypothetical protein [Bacillus cereus]PFT48231.1 hypothetical protein COK72_09100 [Bacillus thuringiensis]